MMSVSIFGIGFSSEGKYIAHIDGANSKSFIKWRGMIQRCYSHSYQKSYPTYIGCRVVDDWHDFQRFAEWYENHGFYGEDYQLDKDLLISGNKVYSPEACCLVPQELNSLLLDRRANRGEYPQGVYLYKPNGSFVAKLRINGKRKHLGYYDCPNEAHKAYVIAKEAHVKEKALEWRDRVANDVFNALMSWTVTK